MQSFFKAYKDILVYHDYGPLLLFWNIADLANNRVLWMSYGEAVDGGNEWAYFQYALYFVVALGMLFSLPNVRSCSRFVGVYLLLYIFSVIFLQAASGVLVEDHDSGSQVLTGQEKADLLENWGTVANLEQGQSRD